MCGTNNDLYSISSTCAGFIYLSLFKISLIFDSFPETIEHGRSMINVHPV